MDRILNRVCSIRNHPISCLDIPFKNTYIKGLGACLYKLSNNSSVVHMYFDVWAKCILGSSFNVSDVWREDNYALKSAISLQRNGFRFFSMKYPFIFDVFYLLQSAQKNGFSTSLADSTFLFLKTNVCGFFSKGALNKVYNLFLSKEYCKQIPYSLIQHMNQNESFLKSQEKKILVVANVSAGKSTLINSLVGYRLNRTKTTACTRRLALLSNKLSEDGITVCSNNNAYSYSEDIEAVNSDNFKCAAFPFNSHLSKNSICLIDTPGINNVDDIKHRKVTEEALKSADYDAVIYVSNCQYFGTNDEHNLLQILKNHVKTPIIFVLNQLDRFKQKEDSIAKMVKDYSYDLRKIGFNSPTICPLSAQAALLFKLPDEKLDEEDKEDKEKWEIIFKKEYYDLPSYVGVRDSKTVLDKTGITNLENQLLNI